MIRYTYIGKSLRKHLLIYIGERKKGNLFKLTSSGVFQLMKRLKKKTGINHLTAHTFRRTFALVSVRNKVNIHILAKLMGHRDVEMLKQYLDISLDDIKELSYSLIDNL